MALKSVAQPLADVPAEGLKKYREGDFAGALAILSSSDTPGSLLFRGKSLYVLGRYTEAIDVLDKITGDAVYGQEALFTMGLALFQNRDYPRALEFFYRVSKGSGSSELKSQAQQIYTQVLDFLDDKQRAYVARNALSKEVRQDAAKSTPTKKSINGFSAQIGIAVPMTSKDDELFEVSQGLFNGFLLAIDQFNEESRDYKIFVRHLDTFKKNARMADIASQALYDAPLDLIFGPLFSHQASEMAQFAEQFEIPMLAPLANLDTLATLNPYVFQLNPVFGLRGKAMAEFAVGKMKYDSLTVVAERGSLGEAEAIAFVSQAQRMGAVINYFFLQDLERLKYDITPFIQHVSTDKKLIDSLKIVPSKAIYLPFTGQAAQALIENALTDLEVMNPNIVVLGSEEWGTAELNNTMRSKRTIFYTQGFQEPPNTKTAMQVKQAYKDRFGASANRWTFIGYDAGQFVASSLQQVQNPTRLRRFWLDRGLHEGYVARINFIRSNVNKGVRIMKLTNAGPVEIR
jgi:ABC-type branched-subunit amino acid transport system substrate-binding protein